MGLLDDFPGVAVSPDPVPTPAPAPVPLLDDFGTSTGARDAYAKLWADPKYPPTASEDEAMRASAQREQGIADALTAQPQYPPGVTPQVVNNGQEMRGVSPVEAAAAGALGYAKIPYRAALDVGATGLTAGAALGHHFGLLSDQTLESAKANEDAVRRYTEAVMGYSPGGNAVAGFPGGVAGALGGTDRYAEVYAEVLQRGLDQGMQPERAKLEAHNAAGLAMLTGIGTTLIAPEAKGMVAPFGEAAGRVIAEQVPRESAVMAAARTGQAIQGAAEGATFQGLQNATLPPDEQQSIAPMTLLGALLHGAGNVRAPMEKMALEHAAAQAAAEAGHPGMAQEYALPGSPETIPTDTSTGPGPVTVTPRNVFEVLAEQRLQEALPPGQDRPGAQAEIDAAMAEQEAALKAKNAAEVDSILNHQIATDGLPEASQTVPYSKPGPHVEIPGERLQAPDTGMQTYRNAINADATAALVELDKQRQERLIGKPQMGVLRQQIADAKKLRHDAVTEAQALGKPIPLFRPIAEEVGLRRNRQPIPETTPEKGQNQSRIAPEPIPGPGSKLAAQPADGTVAGKVAMRVGKPQEPTAPAGAANGPYTLLTPGMKASLPGGDVVEVVKPVGQKFEVRFTDGSSGFYARELLDPLPVAQRSPRSSVEKTGTRNARSPAPTQEAPTVLGHGATPDLAAELWGEKPGSKSEAPAQPGAVAQAVTDIKKIVAPQTRSKAAEAFSHVIREAASDLAQRNDRVEAALREAKKVFDRMPVEENHDFIHRMETHQPQATPALDGVARLIRHILDTKRDEIIGLGTGKLTHFYADYFPHMWDNPTKAAQIFGKRPLEGPKSFLKERTYSTFKEGLDAGLKPISDNPADFVMLKAREMDRYITGQKIMSEGKAKYGFEFHRATTKDLPEGMGKINDAISQVYGPPTLKVEEHVNKNLYEALSKVADNLGVKHDRKMSAGRGALGYSIQGGNQIVSKFGTDLSVIAHEISHQLDHKYDLQSIFMTDPTMNRELRALADLHEYKKQYFRKAEEKMASILEAYVRAPDKFQEVAPHVWTRLQVFMDQHPEMHPLRDMEQSLAEKKLTNELPHGGILKYGEYIAPEPVANLLNNYLSPGLRNNGIFRAYLGLGNVINQFQLGFSAFHLGFTTLDAVISKASIALKSLMAGRVLSAAKHASEVPVAFATNFRLGSKVLREWYKPGSEGAEIARIVDAMKAGGGRARMDNFYKTAAADRMMEAFRKGNPLNGLLRVPTGVTDLTTRPIMEYLVPRQKLGVFADMARFELEKLGPNASREQVRASMAKAWDSVDNRMGQLVYDNLFWNKTFKDLAMASVRSVGWNIGTIREVGGGLVDTAKFALDTARFRKPEFTHRMAYTAMMPVVTGIIGATTQYLMTGKGPESLKDYFFPRTGEIDENGNEIRLALPTYMKDLVHYQHDPIGTLANKAHPLVSMVSEMLRNEDYFGNDIRNKDDPIVTQLLDELKYIGGNLTPMAFKNLSQGINSGMSGGELAGNFAGITRAPKYVDQTPAEELAYKLSQDLHHGGGSSPEVLQQRREILRALRENDPKARGMLERAVASGTFTTRQSSNLIKQGNEPHLVHQVQELGVTGAMRVWRQASEDERSILRPVILHMINNSQSMNDMQKIPLRQQLGY